MQSTILRVPLKGEGQASTPGKGTTALGHITFIWPSFY
jgi:hypothetical protein